MTVNLVKDVEVVTSKLSLLKKLDLSKSKLSVDLVKEVLDLSNVYEGIQDKKACEPPKPKPKPKQKKTTGKKTVQARQPRKYQPKDIKRIAKRIQDDNPCADNDLAIAAAVASCVGGLTWVDVAIAICEAVHEMIAIIKNIIDDLGISEIVGNLELICRDLNAKNDEFISQVNAVIKFYDDIAQFFGVDISLDVLSFLADFRAGQYNMATPLINFIRTIEEVVRTPQVIYECVLVHVDNTAVWLLAFLRKFRVYLLAFTE